MPDPVIMQGIGQQEEQQRRQQRRQPLRQHTPTQSTTFLVVSRRDGGGRCTGLITGGADIAVQTAAVTHASTTSISGYEQRYSTQGRGPVIHTSVSLAKLMAAAATVAETENKPPSESEFLREETVQPAPSRLTLNRAHGAGNRTGCRGSGPPALRSPVVLVSSAPSEGYRTAAWKPIRRLPGQGLEVIHQFQLAIPKHYQCRSVSA